MFLDATSFTPNHPTGWLLQISLLRTPPRPDGTGTITSPYLHELGRGVLGRLTALGVGGGPSPSIPLSLGSVREAIQVERPLRPVLGIEIDFCTRLPDAIAPAIFQEIPCGPFKQWVTRVTHCLNSPRGTFCNIAGATRTGHFFKQEFGK